MDFLASCHLWCYFLLSELLLVALPSTSLSHFSQWTILRATGWDRRPEQRCRSRRCCGSLSVSLSHCGHIDAWNEDRWSGLKWIRQIHRRDELDPACGSVWGGVYLFCLQRLNKLHKPARLLSVTPWAKDIQIPNIFIFNPDVRWLTSMMFRTSNTWNTFSGTVFAVLNRHIKMTLWYLL